MGREWYLKWGTKSYSKKRGATGGCGSGGGDKGEDTKTAAEPPETVTAAAAMAGRCMKGVLHLFDFHHFQLCLHSHYDNPPAAASSASVKGVEAARNSLEPLEQMVTRPPSLAYSIIQDGKSNEYLYHIPENRRDTRLEVLVKAVPRGKMQDLSSETSCSPAGPRTPNLVARLMGLDILPESNTGTTTTPISSNSQPLPSPHKPNSTVTGTHKPNSTLTGTQKPKTRRRSRNDVEQQRRLSLQINKENSIVKEMESSRPSCSGISSTKYEEEYNCRSPAGIYARQIMKQVRETVSRRVGVDITNTVGRNRRDEHLLKAISTKINKSNKKELNPVKNSSDLSPSTVLSYSPRFNSENQSASEKAISRYDDTKSCWKKTSPLKSLHMIRNRKEQFVHTKKCKNSTSLSSDRTSIAPLRKDSPSRHATKSLGEQGSSSKARPLKSSTSIRTNINTGKGTSMSTAMSSRIPIQRFKRMQQEATQTPAVHVVRVRIDEDTPVSFTRWLSPSHPLDPSIFHNYLTSDDTEIEEEGEAIVSRIERDILDSLVQELAHALLG